MDCLVTSQGSATCVRVFDAETPKHLVDSGYLTDIVKKKNNNNIFFILNHDYQVN